MQGNHSAQSRTAIEFFAILRLTEDGRQHRAQGIGVEMKMCASQNGYATGCQQFVTNDMRLYDKVRAVYRYFDVPTQVMKLEDFLARDYS